MCRQMAADAAVVALCESTYSWFKSAFYFVVTRHHLNAPERFCGPRNRVTGSGLVCWFSPITLSSNICSWFRVEETSSSSWPSAACRRFTSPVCILYLSTVTHCLCLLRKAFISLLDFYVYRVGVCVCVTFLPLPASPALWGEGEVQGYEHTRCH